MEKTISVGGKAVRMRASALVPRLYRFKLGRDMIKDMSQLEAAYKKASDSSGEEMLSVLDLTIFENVAWVMCKAADPSVPDDPDEWLDQIDGVFSVYEVLPQIMELWSMGLATTSTPVKK